MDSQNIKVLVRIRPLNSREAQQGASSCIVVESPATVLLDTKPEQKRFQYDYVSDESQSQEDIFNIVGKPMCQVCLEGLNCCIFAYGQTGSGKTFTMLGDAAQPGLQPRVFEELFECINHTGGHVEWNVKCSYLEIYNEQILDLLNPSSKQPLSIREDVRKGVYVENLIEEQAVSYSSIVSILQRGGASRHIGGTLMNTESSRSHAIFILNIESRVVRQGITQTRRSRLNFVDLAGSERQKSTASQGDRLKEAGQINKSLSVLGLVINSLVENSFSPQSKRHVPYRDSKLTFILRESLGGNSKTFMIANISAATTQFQETLSTLKFAQRAKLIKNQAMVNEDLGGSVEMLKAEILRLKTLLTQSGNGESDQMKLDLHKKVLNSTLRKQITIRDLQDQYNISQSEYNRLQDSLTNEINTLNDQIAQMQEELDTAGSSLEFQNEELGKRQQQIEERDATINQLQLTVQQLHDHQYSLQRDHQSETRRYQEQLAELEMCQEQLRATEKALKKAQIQIKESQKAVTTLTQDIQSLQTTLEAKTVLMEHLNKDKADLILSNNQLQDALEEKDGTIQGLTQQNTEISHRVRDQQKQIDQVRHRLTAKEEECLTKSAQIQQMKEYEANLIKHGKELLQQSEDLKLKTRNATEEMRKARECADALQRYETLFEEYNRQKAQTKRFLEGYDVISNRLTQKEQECQQLRDEMRVELQQSGKASKELEEARQTMFTQRRTICDLREQLSIFQMENRLFIEQRNSSSARARPMTESKSNKFKIKLFDQKVEDEQFGDLLQKKIKF